MHPPSEQLIRDYLNRMSVAARTKLGFRERQALLDRTRSQIEAACGGLGGASAAQVRKALANLGDPVAVVELEHARIAGSGEALAGPVPVQGFKPLPADRVSAALASTGWPALPRLNGNAGNGAATEGRGQDTGVREESQRSASSPDASRPDSSRPDASRPDASRPDASRPGASRPDAAPAAGRRPDAVRPATGWPGATPGAAKRDLTGSDTGSADVVASMASRPDAGSANDGTPNGRPAGRRAAVTGAADGAAGAGTGRAAGSGGGISRGSSGRGSSGQGRGGSGRPGPGRGRGAGGGPPGRGQGAGSGSGAGHGAGPGSGGSGHAGGGSGSRPVPVGGSGSAGAKPGSASGLLWQLADGAVVLARRNLLEMVALALLGIGGAVFPPLWLVGAAIAIGSRAWDLRDKWIGLAGPVVAVVITVVLVLILSGARNTIGSYATEAWIAIGRASRIAAVVGAAYLLWRLHRGPREPKQPPWPVPGRRR